MAPQSFSTSSYLILFLLSISSLACICHAHYSQDSSDETVSSPLDFVKKMNGAHKGLVSKGLTDTRVHHPSLPSSGEEPTRAPSIAPSINYNDDNKMKQQIKKGVKKGFYPPEYRCVGILGVCGKTFSAMRCSQLCFDYFSGTNPYPHCGQYPGSEADLCYCEHDCYIKR